MSTQLGDLSSEALLKLTRLVQQYPKRFKKFKKNLERWLINPTPSVWLKLEAQDTKQILKRTNFEKVIEILIDIDS